MNNVYQLQYNEEKKYIEDIIDARKKNGEYNIHSNLSKGPNAQGTARYAYSTPRGMLDERNFIPDETRLNIEGDITDRDNNYISIGPTDSEITVVRVKRESSQLKAFENNWDMHDKAIPGDGRHLGESPSLVNLVTLVKSSKQCLHPTKSKEQVEYLVPLSSWEPNQRNESVDLSLSSKISSSDESVQSGRQLIGGVDKEGIYIVPVKRRRLNFAGKLSIFFRRYLKKPKRPQE
ncbi:uncharacterized protein [Onthophagus taurus]|uniref:uncharacterized protein isoform X2 n=1 Tax=Onthophagus taurus TaxID=166361 RepID=UPI0039BE09A1